MKPNRAVVPFPDRTDSEENKPRYNEGWRAGKPVEDPEKTKRWGFITAKPSEYLIHVRGGSVRKRSSGQGATCFKLPWDSVAIIPTTINRLRFAADQITIEKVGVEVTGLAVYRIVDPEMTYRMLNFSFTERAQEKLEAILSEMFMGSVRRIVANMTVEQVLTQRKEGLAGEILSEIQPIVSGRGRADDRTNRGWGVVLDTVEIQDVRVLSESVFANMQAVFRNQLLLRARDAELTAAKELAEKETRNAKEIIEAKISAEAATRELKAKAESSAAEIEVAEQMKRDKLRAAAEKTRIAEKQAIDQQLLQSQMRLEAEKAAAEAAKQLAEIEKQKKLQLAQLAKQQAEFEEQRKLEDAKFVAEREASEHQAELEQWKTQAKIELDRAELAARLESERAESEAKSALEEKRLAIVKLEGETRNDLALGSRQIDNLITEEAIRRDLVTKTMPAIAEAFAQNFGEMRFLQMGGNGDGQQADPLSFIARAFAQVMEVAQQAGLGKKPEPPAAN